jgi:hypothetical protein
MTSTGGLAHPCPGARLSQTFGNQHVRLADGTLYYNYYARMGYAGHPGNDFGIPVGSALYAPHDGVLEAYDTGARGNGLHVKIVGAEGWSLLGHLSAIVATSGGMVRKRQLIARSGNTGDSTGPHVHWEWHPHSASLANGYKGAVDGLLALEEDLMDRGALVGPHINTIVNEVGMLNWFAKYQPAIALVIDQGAAASFVRRARAASPGTFWVGRWWEEFEPTDDPVRQGRERAERILRTELSEVVDCCQGDNEHTGYPYRPNPGHEACLRYFDKERALADTLHRAGRRYAGGAWSVQHPDIQWLNDPAYRALVLDCYDFFLCHEYDAPTMREARSFNFPVTNWEDTLIGERMLRYRHVLNALGDACPPIIVGEFGIDSLAPNPHLADRHYGYRKYMSAAQFTQDVAWFDRQLRRDNAKRLRVVGGLWYCMGVADDQWRTFDTWEHASNELGAYILSQRATGTSPVELVETALERTLYDALERVAIPRTPGHALSVYGLARGWEYMSPEQTVNGYACQMWFNPRDGRKYYVYTKVGEWDQAMIRHFSRPN